MRSLTEAILRVPYRRNDRRKEIKADAKEKEVHRISRFCSNICYGDSTPGVPAIRAIEPLIR